MFLIYYARCIISLFTSFSHIAFCEADSSLSASCASYPSPAGWRRSRVVQHYLCSSCPDCSDSADCSYSGCSYFCRSCSCLYSDLCSDPYSACLCSCPCFYPCCSYRSACSASGKFLTGANKSLSKNVPTGAICSSHIM